MQRRSILLVMDSIAQMVEVTRLAEAGGFDLAWSWEFFNKNAFVRLAAMAAATSRIGLGTGIAYAFGRSPLLTASAAADLDELSGGRLLLGLGTGTRRMNEDWYGMPFEHPAPKAGELCRLLRHIWASASGPMRFEGRFYKLSVPQYTRPGQTRERIPILLAGVNPLMVRTAAEAADGLVGHPIYPRSYIRDYVRPAVEDGLRRAERPREEFTLASCVIVAISRDREQARREARQQVAFYSTVKTYDLLLDSAGFTREKDAIRAAFRTLSPSSGAGQAIEAMAAAVSDEMLAATAVAGTPDECRAQLAAYDDLLDLPMLYTPTFGVDPDRVLENHRLIVETFGTT
ncbi:MAG: LLM class flavin-dependent oxidoreductase [Chloroflexi bacterium]|nr:LLM class flavin-dependent oxidoreductase [Chloroflexota bacterium]